MATAPITREQIAEILARLIPIPDKMGPGQPIPPQGPVPENLFPIEKMGTLPPGIPEPMPDATSSPEGKINEDHSTRNKILALLGGLGGVGLGAALGGKNFMGGLEQGIRPIPGIIMQNRRMKESRDIRKQELSQREKDKQEQRRLTLARFGMSPASTDEQIAEHVRADKEAEKAKTKKTDFIEDADGNIWRLEDFGKPDKKPVSKKTQKDETPKFGNWELSKNGKVWTRTNPKSGALETMPADPALAEDTKPTKLPASITLKYNQAKMADNLSRTAIKMLEDPQKSKVINDWLGTGIGKTTSRWLSETMGGAKVTDPLGIFTIVPSEPKEVTDFKTTLMTLRDKITRGETGAAMPESEVKFYEALVGGMGMDPKVLMNHLLSINEIVNSSMDSLIEPLPKGMESASDLESLSDDELQKMLMKARGE